MKIGSDYTENNGLIIGDDELARPAWAAHSELLRDYYDTEWGMPVRDEQGLFERLSLEVFQAGLSWETVLKKRPAFREAFANFDPDAVADFDDEDVERLMNDERIIRNRRKITAVINNAEATIALREHGGLAELMWSFKPEKSPEPRSIEEVPSFSEESKALTKALKKAGFKFVCPPLVVRTMPTVLIGAINLVRAHRPGAARV
ncbi:DNA-3-methyladenine glycosylase I, partial [uncultured Corynebacterium sp.]|uniref:DNA-3-methyladenine glycosylase I n=1 Tax=uncultured Corynebacterium sp. TaxID=159447 RepID=UPI0028044245